MSDLRTALFINAHSRRARHMADRVVADFKKDLAGFEIVDIIVVKDLAQLPDQLEQLKAIPRLQCVIIGSGDGTIVTILNALRNRKLIYGFLPLGTSNTFMNSLDLPLSYPLARRVILKQHARPVSIGSINGKRFANIAGIGIPTQVTETTTNKIKKILGPFAYVFNGVKAIAGHQAFFCRITNDDRDESFYTHYLLFANGNQHGGLSLGKDVSVFNDKLTLLAFGVSQRRRHILRGIANFLLGRRQDPQVKMIPFEKLRVTTKPKRAIEADGEIIAHTPATIEIKPEAIQVLVKPQRQSRKSRKNR